VTFIQDWSKISPSTLRVCWSLLVRNLRA